MCNYAAKHATARAMIHAGAELSMRAASGGIVLHRHAVMACGLAAAGRQRGASAGGSQQRRHKAEPKQEQQRNCKELTQ